MYFLLKIVIFHCHVTLLEGTENYGSEKVTPALNMAILRIHVSFRGCKLLGTNCEQDLQP